MKAIATWLLSLVLASCAPIEVVAQPTVVTTKSIPTNTSPPHTPRPSVTPTAELLCDPFHEDFCITNGYFMLQRPIHPPANDLVDASYRYGSTAEGTRQPHHGVEFANPSETPIYAAAKGTVVFADADQAALYSPWPDFYGNLVVIEHEGELFTLYAHLSKIDVKPGQVVGEGTRIGEVGRTGVAIGSHLHFEVRRGNGADYYATRNPELLLVPARGVKGDAFGVLAMTVIDRDRRLVDYAEFTVRYYPGQSQKAVKSYYGITYPANMLNGDENAVLGELPAGRYRIAVERNGRISERWVEVESGKLTQVVIVVK